MGASFQKRHSSTVLIISRVISNADFGSDCNSIMVIRSSDMYE